MVATSALPCPVTLLSLLFLLRAAASLARSSGLARAHGGGGRAAGGGAHDRRWGARSRRRNHGGAGRGPWQSPCELWRRGCAGSGARRGTAGAEPHTAGGKLRASNIGLGVDSPRRAHPLLPSRSATRECSRRPRLRAIVVGLFLDKMEVEEDDRMRRKTVTRSLTAWPHRLEKEGYSRHRHWLGPHVRPIKWWKSNIRWTE